MCKRRKMDVTKTVYHINVRREGKWHLLLQREAMYPIIHSMASAAETKALTITGNTLEVVGGGVVVGEVLWFTGALNWLGNALLTLGSIGFPLVGVTLGILGFATGEFILRKARRGRSGGGHH